MNESTRREMLALAEGVIDAVGVNLAHSLGELGKKLTALRPHLAEFSTGAEMLTRLVHTDPRREDEILPELMGDLEAMNRLVSRVMPRIDLYVRAHPPKGDGESDKGGTDKPGDEKVSAATGRQGEWR